MPIKYDLIGKVFGRVTILSFLRAEHKIGNWWLCKCRCGNTFERPTYVITRDRHRNQSCGKCYDGQKYPKEYDIWAAMYDRCYNKNNPYYYRYGGRGITICQEWRMDFLNFYDDMGSKPEGYSINRKDNDGEYSKNNCTWSTIEEQNDTKTQRNGQYNETLVQKWQPATEP